MCIGKPFAAYHGLALAGLLVLAACRSRAELALRDTEGRRYAARCPGAQSSCALERRSGPATPAGARPALRSNGRLVGVCDARGDSVHLADCRPLICSSDSECPPVHGLETGACVGSLCVNPANSLITEDAVMLCLAGTGVGHEKPAQVERYALALNCGEPCAVPAPCEYEPR